MSPQNDFRRSGWRLPYHFDIPSSQPEQDPEKMRAADLDLRELLHFEPKGGLMYFAGERVLLLDPVALGLARKEMIARTGLTLARAMLTRFGYAHGWRTAETMKTAIPWDNDDEWRWAGG